MYICTILFGSSKIEFQAMELLNKAKYLLLCILACIIIIWRGYVDNGDFRLTLMHAMGGILLILSISRFIKKVRQQ